MDVITIIIIVVVGPILLISYFYRDKPGSSFGPTVCSRCNVELRGWHSSGKKQMWKRTDASGKTIYFCAKCKNK